MREIKFRGKSIDTGEWVYGSLQMSELDVNQIAVNCHIHERFAADSSIRVISVIPESVGQFTGLRDKNGVEIYEGDIVRAEGQTYRYIQIIEFHNSEQTCGRGWIGRNIIQEESVTMKTDLKRIDDRFSYFCWPTSWEIIGNVYEHKHLIEQLSKP